METKKQSSLLVNRSLLTEVHVAFLCMKDETPSDNMRNAFEMCKINEDASWLCLDDIDHVDKKDTVFVCEEFKGETFERLKRDNARIIGPHCVITCIKKDENVPLLPYPIYTATMKGLEVCCTNVSRSLREQLHEKVKLMGGVVHREFSVKVTHLVAGEVGSKKYYVACNNNKPVMLPEWVEECWKVGQMEIVHASDERFRVFRCPIFKGLQVTVSQLDSKERRKVQKIIESNGGSYSGNLQVHSTTHLVCLEPTGEKYKVAKQKSITCVKRSWIYDSVQKGYCLNGRLYSFENEESAITLSASTPNSKAKVSKPALPDASIISNNNSRAAVNETAASNWSVLNMSSKSVVSTDTSIISNKHSDSSILKKLEALHCNSYEQFLDGCKIVLSGFSPLVTEHLRKVLNVGGATRFSQINDNVSHVILGSEIDEHYKIILEGKFRPQVVNIEWLFACMSEGRPVEEKDFYCSNLSSLQVPVSPFAKSTAKEKESGTSVGALSQLKDTKVPSYAEEEMDEMMHQYLMNGQSDVRTIFNGLTFATSNCDKINDDVINIIVQYGGKMACASDVNADYIIVPILGSSTMQNQRCVTPYWIDCCIEAETLLDESSNPLFVPVYINPEVQPLKGCVLSLSQFSSLERDYLVQISVSLGAKYQEYFARQTSNSRGVLGCTHLISKIPEGSKYLGAIKWGVPVVTMKWLLKCAETNSRVSEESYLLGESKPSTITEANESYHAPDFGSQIKDSKVLPINATSSVSNKSLTPPVSVVAFPPTTEKLCQIRERIRGGYQTPSLHVSRIKKLFCDEPDSQCNTSCESPQLTPSKILNPDNIKSKINIRDAMASLDSPVHDRSSARSPTSKLTIEDLYGLKIKQAIKHELETGEGIVRRNEYDDSIENCNITGPLNGLIIVVSRKLSHEQSDLNKIVETLGGKYRWKYDKSCTHFIHQGKCNDFNKELKAARDDGKFLVSPQWLRDCQEKRARLDETLYPYTYNPQLSLDLSTEKETNDSKTFTINASSHSVSSSTLEASQSAEIRETAHRKIDEILAATKVAKDKRITKRYTTKSNISSPMDANKKPLHRPRTGVKKDCDADNAEPVESLPITWDDPTSRIEREKLAAKLSKDSQSVSPYRGHGFEEEHIEDICAINTSEKWEGTLVEERPKSELRIMLAGFSNQERGKYNAVIQSIGGIVINSSNFDVTCTHLIASNPNRTEKYLASLASGKWVLQTSYLIESEKAGSFVKEEEHEWGRKDTSHLEFLHQLNSDQQKLARAAYVWRTKLQEEKSRLPPKDHCTVGAYKNWNAIICTNEQRSSSFRRLLEAGAARVTCINSSISNADGITHAFMELAKVQSFNIDLNVLLKSGVLCLKPDYLGYHLVEEEPEINLSNYYVPEVLPLFASSQQYDCLTMKRKSQERSDTGKRARQ